MVPVVYHTRNPAKDVSYQHYPDLMQMAGDVDTLVVIVPGGASTNKMINAEVMKALGPRGVIVNVARGTVIDQEALMLVLRVDHRERERTEVDADVAEGKSRYLSA